MAITIITVTIVMMNFDLALIVLLVLSIGFLVLWYLICVHGTDCAVLNQGRHVVWWIIRAAPVIAFIAGIIGWRSMGPLCGLYAFVSFLIFWGYWALVLTILDELGRRIGCIVENF